MTEINKGDIYIGGKEKCHANIVDYNPNWKLNYQFHAEKIAKALGSQALLIEHIGSTSVKGLAAKPVIDILVVVRDSSDERSYVRKMIDAGYILRIREPDWHEHRMFRNPTKDANIHFYSKGCTEISRVLNFRDWLRTHPKDCLRYESNKRKLSKQDWECVDDYAQAKTEIIEMILEKTDKSNHSSRY